LVNAIVRLAAENDVGLDRDALKKVQELVETGVELRDAFDRVRKMKSEGGGPEAELVGESPDEAGTEPRANFDPSTPSSGRVEADPPGTSRDSQGRLRDLKGNLVEPASRPSHDASSPSSGVGVPERPLIHEGKQGKHIPGHNNFQPGNSELTYPDPQELLDRGSGTGERHRNKEVADFGETIGYYVNKDTGERLPTTRGTIHYDEKGTAHIVPAHPEGRAGETSE